ncbi:MAG: pro-sigmaK processing inhibitor BofA family protein [Candidatus Micrarchaeota archaeon]
MLFLQFEIAGLGFLLIVLAIVLLLVLKRVLINTVLGVLALLIINYFGTPYNLKIAITILTVLITAIFGLAGVGALLILHFLGITVQ